MLPQFMGREDYEFILDVLRADPTPEDAQRGIKCTVILADNSTIELEFGKDYTVELNSDLRGGVVKVVNPRTKGDKIVIYREYELTQTALFQDFNKAPAETTMGVANKAIMLIQQMTERLSRTLTAGIGSTIDLTLPDPDVGKAFIWDKDAKRIVNSRTNVDELEGSVIEAVQAANTAVNSAGNAFNDAERARGYAESVDPQEILSKARLLESSLLYGNIDYNNKLDILFAPGLEDVTAIPFVQPIVTVDGGLGGSKFAVSSDKLVNVYRAFNQNASTYLDNAGVPLPARIFMFNPNPVKCSTIDFTTLAGYTNRTIKNYAVFGSYDGIEYVQIASGQNPGWYPYSIPVHSEDFYKYFALDILSTFEGSYLGVPSITLQGLEQIGASTATVLHFKSGGPYSSLVAKTTQGKIFTHNYLEPVDMAGKPDGKYNFGLSPDGVEFTGKFLGAHYAHPVSASEGDYYYNPMLQDAFRFTDGIWVGGYEAVPLGSTVMKNGVIAEIETFPLNQNGYNVNMKTWGDINIQNDNRPAVVVESWFEGADSYSKRSDGFIEQQGSKRGSNITDIEVLFHIPFKELDKDGNPAYVLITQAGRSDNVISSINNQSFIINKTLKGFRARFYGDGRTDWIDWKASGR